jgi:hypothetical protein
MTSFIFQNNCENEFRLYDAIRNIPSDKIIVLGPKPETNPELECGAAVYLWEAGKPYRGLIARGVVVELRPMDHMPQWQHQFLQPPHINGNAPRDVIRVEHIFNPPIQRQKLQQDYPVLAEESFLGRKRPINRTIFPIDSVFEPHLDRLQ